MLVHEDGDILHLLPAVPDWWLGEGREIVASIYEKTAPPLY
jgi:hypothetical protein